MKTPTLATAETISASWTCKKRDGKEVPFDVSKVRKALYRCFNAVGYLNDIGDLAKAEAKTEQIAKAVVNTLWAMRQFKPDVETVQRLVIQQLWAAELWEAAEHYQNYREQHRKMRASRPIRPEVQERFDEMSKHFPTDLQIYQFMSKFSRWREADNRRETWHETVHDRVIPWLVKQVPAGTLCEGEIQLLQQAMYRMEALPAMRVIQMAGPALDRCHVGAYNCAYAPVDQIFAFPEALYILMQGTGHGFSVENEYISELPRIKKQRGGKPETIVVEDTTESWCHSYHRLLELLFDGHDGVLDVSHVRKKGSRLKTKGGRASGPDPLLELAAFVRNVIKSRQGRFLEDTDAHRIMCFTGRIVQVGGVRRAAMISLSDLDSVGMRTIKSGQWWEGTPNLWPDGKYLSMANNSGVYDFEDGTVPVGTFMDEWSSIYKSNSGERGIFNRQAAYKKSPVRRDWKGMKPGCNPCAEILLRPREFCNLSIAVARPHDTPTTLLYKVRMAAMFGKIQSLCTNFNYIRPEWKQNCEDERLLGVDITGHADCPLLRFGAPGRAELLDMLQREVDEVDFQLSKRFKINRSAANTTVKPSGDSAVFLDCASGVSPRFAEYQIRWVRESATSPVAKFLVDAGVPHAPSPESAELLVFAFPKKSPEGATLVKDMSAKQQFLNWLEWKQHWAQHSVSATLYVEPHEWPLLGAMVYEQIDEITGLSFLPRDNGSYTYPPNEEITREEYERRVAEFPDLNWAKLTEYETEDATESAQTFACVGDKC